METIATHIAAFNEGLAAFIAAAPDNSPANGVSQPTASKYVREAWGWGRKYCSSIPLHGDEWLAALETARPIIETGGIIVMVGDRGPGKTQMAAELARDGVWPDDRDEFSRGDGLVVHRGKTALYRRAMDIFLELREAAKNHIKSSEREVITKMANVGLLVVDEFQERGDTEWENRIMKNLIDKRYASERATIIIANMKRAEIFHALGASIVDRARENGKSIEFTWPSYRG
jgi:DNA replication protein DnaC